MEAYTVIVGALVGIAVVALLGRVRPAPLEIQA
jgi:heme-degrading monooxygenase HmoA